MAPKKSVLVVEDSVDLLEVIQEQLEAEGYDVIPATHGKQAIDFLTTLEGTQPELVVLDLMMPILNGWDVLQQMRMQPRLDTIPVLVMTAATKTKPEGATALIRKPFNREDFLIAVHTTRRNSTGAQPSDLAGPVMLAATKTTSANVLGSSTDPGDTFVQPGGLGATSVTGGGRCILIVDDDKGIRDVLRDVLSLASYEVMEAENGAVALSLLRQTPKPDLVLLDLMMPVLSGWELLESIQAADKDVGAVPIIVISALSAPLSDPGERGGVKACFVKPVDVDVLLDAVEQHLPPRPDPH